MVRYQFPKLRIGVRFPLAPNFYRLKMNTKRTANFYWVNVKTERTPFTGNFFFALYSFLVHHPHWETRLWTNNNFDGEWFQLCLDKGLVVKKLNLKDYPYPKISNPSFIVDYYKCRTLALEGGLICDLNDSITIACHDDVWDKADKLMWANYCAGNKGGIISGGWMLKNSPCKLMEELIKQPVQNDEGKHYELIAPSLIPDFPDDCNQEPSDHKIMFPMLNWQVQNALNSGDWKQFVTKDTRQTHWFFGNIYQSSYHDVNRKYILYESDLEHWWERSGAYVDCFKYAIECSNDTLLKEFINKKTIITTEEQPRIAHFSLMEDKNGKYVKFKDWMYMSINSFMLHHPNWKINLWTNCIIENADKLQECIKNGLNVTYIHLDSIMPHKNIKNIEAINDYTKIWAVYEFGGMAVGLDTITLSNFNILYDNCETLDWVWYGRQPDKNDRMFLSWFLSKKSGNLFLKSLIGLPPETDTGLPLYNKIAPELMKYFTSHLNPRPTEWKMITPTFSQWIPTVLDSKNIQSSLNGVMKIYNWYYDDYEDSLTWKLRKQNIIDTETTMNEGWEKRESAYVQLYLLAIEKKN